jgi:hypothetical protein
MAFRLVSDQVFRLRWPLSMISRVVSHEAGRSGNLTCSVAIGSGTLLRSVVSRNDSRSARGSDSLRM